MTNSQQDLGTWTWTWTSGPLVGTSHCLISNKCELRPCDELDGPAISLWPTPSGFVCQIAGGELEVNGVVSDIHLLKQGDLIQSPDFTARLQYVFAHQQIEPELDDPREVETMDACFLDPSTFQAELGNQVVEEPSMARKKLLIAFRGLRKIKHKILSVPAECTVQIVDSINDISARIDQTTAMIELLLAKLVAPKPVVTDCNAACGCCSETCIKSNSAAIFDLPETSTSSDSCCASGTATFDVEPAIENADFATPGACLSCEESQTEVRDEPTVEIPSLSDESINNEFVSSGEVPCVHSIGNIESDNVPTSLVPMTPNSDLPTQEYCPHEMEYFPELKNSELERIQNVIGSETDISTTQPIEENPTFSLESETNFIDQDTQEPAEWPEPPYVESDRPATAEVNLAQEAEVVAPDPLNSRQQLCNTDAGSSAVLDQEPIVSIDSPCVSESTQPVQTESLSNSKLDIPPQSNLSIVVGDIQELIEHARRKADLRIAETQRLSKEKAIEFTAMNSGEQESAFAVNSLVDGDASTQAMPINEEVELIDEKATEIICTEKVSTDEVSTEAFARPTCPTASEVAAHAPVESWASLMTSIDTPESEVPASENSSEVTVGDVYADAAHVFVPLREMSVTSQIRFNEVLSRLNTESVDVTEITDSVAAPSISDNELLGLNSFDLTIEKDDPGITPDYLVSSSRDQSSGEILSMTAEQWLNQQFEEPTTEESEETNTDDPQTSTEIPCLDFQINRKFEEIETELGNIDNTDDLPNLNSPDQQDPSDPNTLSDETKNEIGSLRSRLRDLLGTYSSEQLANLPEVVTAAGLETDSSKPQTHQAETNLQSEEPPMTTPYQSLDSNLASAAFLTQFNPQEEPMLTLDPVPRPIEAPAVRPNHEDESVDDYMSKLFNRLRGKEPERPAPSKSVQAPTETSDVPVVQNEQPALAIEPPLKADEFLPKKQAPERNANMNVLRQLANESTRMAVSQFEVTQQKSMSSTRIACFGGATGFALVFFALSKQLGDLTSLAGLGSAALAASVGVWHLLAMRNNGPEKVQGKTSEHPGK